MLDTVNHIIIDLELCSSRMIQISSRRIHLLASTATYAGSCRANQEPIAHISLLGRLLKDAPLDRGTATFEVLGGVS